MLKKENLKKIFSNDYPGYNEIVTEVISPIFGEDFNYLSDPEDLRIGDEAEASKIISALNPQLHSRSATYIKRNGLLIRKITIKSSRPFQCAYHPLTP